MSRKATPVRLWGRRLCAILLPLLLFVVWWLHDSLAFVQVTAPSGVGVRWSDSQATLNLRLGCRTAAEGGDLPLYGPCWDDAAEHAAEQWNAAEAGFEFHIQSPSRSADPSCGTADGINTVVWADTNCGMAWDDETLAITLYLGRAYADTAEFTDTDVLFNTTYSWSTYSGPQRFGVQDLHRVAIHEFGHVLGLDHPDDHGQFVNALMNSKAGDTDRLQADDIAGIRAIYGGGGSGGGSGLSDDHGDTRQEATEVGLPSDTRGTLEEGGDEDYFRLSVPRSGTLTVETTGSTDTHGALYSAAGSLLTSDDDSGSLNFQIVHQVLAGTYYVKVKGFLLATGPYTLRVRFTASGGGGLGDDHGDTRQEATEVGLPSDTRGTLEEGGDEDYFRLSVPRSGTLTVETTGSTDTHGTLYSATGSLLTSNDDSGSGSNFQIVHQVSAGTYYVKVRGYFSRTTGPYTLRVRFSVGGVLENPGPGAFKSGVGVISGWVCEATRVEVEIAGNRMPAAYGTERTDTRSVCGDTDNGFAILYNWNRLGDGVHTARLLVDGTEFARSTFQVTTLGEEFLRGASKTVTVRDFPRTGSTAVLEWEESSQNFVIREVR